MENAQLALLFLCGFLLSRLLLKARVPEQLVGRWFRRELTPSRLVLYLVALSALLSVFIPNAVTAVTLIPVIVLARQELLEQEIGDHAAITTALALSVIYGANIGGMASITGTPANGVLVAYTALRQIPDHGLLRFDTWLVWGLPLTATLVLLAWGSLVACLSGVRWTRRARAFSIPGPSVRPTGGAAFRMTLSFFVAAVGLSAAMHLASDKRFVLALTAAFTAAFMWALVGRARPTPLLTLADCVRGIPWKGLAVVSIVVVLAILAGVFGVIEHAAKAAASLLPGSLDRFSAFAWIALLTSFTTQFLSNTVVQLALFETLTAHPGAASQLMDLQLVVTLSCTCAFMTPIATGVNGLVYGELDGMSLGRMLFAGAVMNVVAALTIAAAVFYVVARF